ncbi:MAG: DUF485 domain-containing protein [Alphaproteobacteria bacterium]|nr:DUF485 domain-containing protein [Alphaproteobacteria bacterium]
MPREQLKQLGRERWRIALTLSLVVVVIYFGFILLVAFNKPMMGYVLTEGLSVGMLLGALVILAAWLTTWIYTAWANSHYDTTLGGIHDEIRRNKP